MEKEKTETKEPVTTNEFSYDERSRVLTASIIYIDEDNNLKSVVTNTYTGDEAVKRFLNHQKKKKLDAKKTIESVEKIVQDMKDKETNLKKGLKDLTPKQKELMEELRVIGTYQEYDATKQKIVLQEEHLVKMQEGMKEDRKSYEDIKVACKAVDFEFD